MTLVPTLAVSLLAGLVGVAAGRALAPRPLPAEHAPDAEALQQLEQSLARVEAGLEALSAPGTALAPASEAARSAPGAAELEAALARWEAQQAPSEPAVAASAGAEDGAAPRDELADVPIGELVRELAGTNLGDDERQQLFERLRALGRIDEYVAELERLAGESPDDAGLQLALGHAYLQKLFGLEGSTEVGTVAWKADQAFDRALALDDTNWDARFTKAVALSNWPAFLGRGSEAIENFELLIEQQESLPPQAHHALPYLFLGNMLQASGQQKEALATWREGLALFPEHAGLQAALASAGAR